MNDYQAEEMISLLSRIADGLEMIREDLRDINRALEEPLGIGGKLDDIKDQLREIDMTLVTKG